MNQPLLEKQENEQNKAYLSNSQNSDSRTDSAVNNNYPHTSHAHFHRSLHVPCRYLAQVQVTFSSTVEPQ